MTAGEQKTHLLLFYHKLVKDYDKAVEQTKQWLDKLQVTR